VAKKDRAPTPPKRPVQAPQAYREERNPRRSQLIFIALAGAIIIAALAVGVGFIMSGGDDNAGAVAGSCTVDTFPALEATHVEALPDDYEYNSLPATSGVHSPQTAIWNLYDQPVPQLNYLHNLEHGGIVVQYGSQVPEADVSQLAEWYEGDTRGLIVAPFAADVEEEGDAALAGQIVAVSWTHKMTCDGFDEEALDEFSDDYRGPQGDAPEKFPLDSLQQGSN
jgi:hypothetical protein